MRMQVVPPTATMSREIVTPQEAAEWLKSNLRNRALSRHLVELYARDMQEGRWHENGETIKFNRLGELDDGQHRLAACVLADVSFVTWVARDLDPDPDVHATIDSGRKRTVGDVLHIMSLPSANLRASIARIHLAYLRAVETGSDLTSTGNIKLTKQEIVQHAIDCADAYGDVVAAASRIYSEVAKISPTATGAAFAIINDKHGPDVLTSFVSDIVESRDGPCATLRRYYINQVATRYRPIHIMFCTLKAFKAWRRGAVGARHMRWHESEGTIEI